MYLTHSMGTNPIRFFIFLFRKLSYFPHLNTRLTEFLYLEQLLQPLAIQIPTPDPSLGTG